MSGEPCGAQRDAPGVESAVQVLSPAVAQSTWPMRSPVVKMRRSMNAPVRPVSTSVSVSSSGGAGGQARLMRVETIGSARAGGIRRSGGGGQVMVGGGGQGARAAGGSQTRRLEARAQLVPTPPPCAAALLPRSTTMPKVPTATRSTFNSRVTLYEPPIASSSRATRSSPQAHLPADVKPAPDTKPTKSSPTKPPRKPTPFKLALDKPHPAPKRWAEAYEIIRKQREG